MLLTPTAHSYGSHALQQLYLYPPPPSSTLWILFIHGGAWRDPRITPSVARPLFTALQHPLGSTAGFASIGYRLSPHELSPHNNARHPDHVNDVVAAIRWLKKSQGMARFVLIGHSCGATLAFQGAAREGGCEMVVGVEGIYALESLIEEGGEGYRGFVEGAFGEKGWAEVSPAVAGMGAWRGLAVLAHSDQDELVGWRQVEEMKGALEERTGGVGGVRVVKVHGGHDEVLQEGAVERLAIVVERYVRELGF